MGLTLNEIVAGLAGAVIAGKKAADAAIVAIEAISPDALKDAEEAIRLQLDAQLDALNVTVGDLTSALANAASVIQSGKGPTAGGPDASMS